MKTIFGKLCVLFALQCVVFAGFAFYESGQTVAEPRKLIDIDFSLIDGFETRSSQRFSKLKKVNGQWLVSNYENLPADQELLERFFNDLKSMEVLWPVASSELAAERFKVTEARATNTLTFYQGDTVLATLYKGTTAEWRTVHVRMNDDAEIYTIPIELHRFNSTPIDWFDKKLLAVKGDIERVSTTHFSLEKRDDQWLLDPLPDSNIVNPTVINEWVNYFNEQSVFRLTYNVQEYDSVLNLPIYDRITVQTSFAEQRFEVYKKEKEVFIREEGKDKVFKINSKNKDHYINIPVERFSRANAS